MLTVAEKIRLILGRKKITITDLADKLGKSRANITNQLLRDNFTWEQMNCMADALGMDVDVIFTDRKTGEKI